MQKLEEVLAEVLAKVSRGWQISWLAISGLANGKISRLAIRGLERISRYPSLPTGQLVLH